VSNNLLIMNVLCIASMILNMCYLNRYTRFNYNVYWNRVRNITEVISIIVVVWCIYDICSIIYT